EHYLMKLLDARDTDLAFINRHFGVDPSRLVAELTRSIDGLKSGNARTPALSPSLVKMMTEAWTIASIDFDASSIRSGFTILALVTDSELGRLVREATREMQKISAEVLRQNLLAIVAASKETVADGLNEPTSRPAAPATPGKTPNLDQYTIDLT